MRLIEVGDLPIYKREFLLLPVRLYAQDDNWIRPLDQDIEATFDPERNTSFQNGTCIRWILQDDGGQTIGRVAAFVNYETAQREEQPTGGMGLFECVNDQAAAFVLFDACRAWLSERGMEAMDGPVNFGERDSWWGLMVKGWEHEPTYKMPWTKAYYIDFFEAYGFRDYFQQYVYVSPIRAANVLPSVEEKAQRIYNNPEYHFEHLRLGRWQRYAEDFRTIYNLAWSKFPGIREMSAEVAIRLFRKIKPIVDEELIWFAYAGTKPVAFFIVIPDINQIIKHLNGQFNWWAKLKFLLLLWRGVITRTCGLVFGVVPEYQGRGVESAIALRFRQAGRDNPHFQYETIDMNWVGDFNPKMVRFASQLGTNLHKQYITYRYLFDRSKPFKRCPRV